MGATEAQVSRRERAWGIPLPRATAWEPPYLPLLAFWVLDHAEEGDSIVELPELQERGDLGEFLLSEARPHADVYPAAPSGHKPHADLA